MMKRAVGLLMMFCWVGVSGLTAKVAVSEITLRTVPQELRVRPTESIVIQMKAYGQVTDRAGQPQRVRIRRSDAVYSLSPADGAWLSKPFRFQGADDEPFHASDNASLVDLIFDRVTDATIIQDCVLFTAGHRIGDVTVTATLEGKRAALTIRVAGDAPSRRTPETANFAAESASADPYRPLAEHYAPFIAQETWFHPKADYLARFDFDKNWYGDDNWANADTGSSQAYVYYAVMETETHWFLIYNLFHPRDYSDKCVAGTCHENDNEGLILTVAKDGGRWGRLQAMETLAHNNVYSYRADRQVGTGVHDIDGEVQFGADKRPAVYVESGGHGIFGVGDPRARYELAADRFSSGTGVTYKYKGKAERPKHPNDRQVGYELLPIRDQWWARTNQAGRMFADYYTYAPYGERPGIAGRQIPRAFLGREMGANMAKPFWGWHDDLTRRKKVLATGQWALDPAYSISRALTMPQPFAVDYIHNPYLGFDRVGQAPGREDASSGGGTGEEVVITARSAGRVSGDREQFDIRLEADELLLVRVQDDTVRCVAEKGRPALDQGTACSAPLPPYTPTGFRMDTLDGRGDVRLLEPPSAANGFTATLRIEDSKKGSDRYHVRLSWAAGAVTPGGDGGGSGAAERAAELPGLSLPVSTDGSIQTAGGAEGFFDFQARVDGTVELWLRGRRANIQVISGDFVKQPKCAFSQTLPARPASFDLKRWEGRGDIRLLETPGAANGWTARIRISDPGSGDDLYRFTLSWQIGR
ncbi:MAG: hypothetical protein KBB56_09255 [Acidobacteria bacterium]|nr:hypothetical protein [Acidobacteriota bacterium]